MNPIFLFSQVFRGIDSPYAGFGCCDQFLTLNLTQDVWQHITNSTHDLLECNCKHGINGVNDCIIIGENGIYEIEVVLIFSGENKAKYEFAFEVNGTMDSFHRCCHEMNSKLTQTTTILATLELENEDSIKLMIRNIANNRDITIIGIVGVVKKINN